MVNDAFYIQCHVDEERIKGRMAFVSLIDSEALAPGSAAEVVANGRVFAVFNIDGVFHVIDGICSHAGGPLGKGMVRNSVVTCPWHGWQFDVSNGQHCLNSRICQTRYAVRIEDGRVEADLG